MPIVIDGYNLLHSIRKASPVRSRPEERRYGISKYQQPSNGASEGSEQISDVGLCRIINEYLKLAGEKGEIVFDGTGPRDKSIFDNISNLEVFFAGPGADADSIIESKIKASTAPRRLTVVSSDRRIQAAAHSRRATVIKALIFWDDLCKRLSRRKKKPKEPTQKREGLTDGETDQWLKFFGLEQ